MHEASHGARKNSIFFISGINTTHARLRALNRRMGIRNNGCRVDRRCGKVRAKIALYAKRNILVLVSTVYAYICVLFNVLKEKKNTKKHTAVVYGILSSVVLDSALHIHWCVKCKRSEPIFSFLLSRPNVISLCANLRMAWALYSHASILACCNHRQNPRIIIILHNHQEYYVYIYLNKCIQLLLSSSFLSFRQFFFFSFSSYLQYETIFFNLFILCFRVDNSAKP